MEHLARAGQRPQGVAVVWIALFCNFTTFVASTSEPATSGAIAEVVVASRRRISVFLLCAFLAGCTLQVEQHCQILEHMMTSFLCGSWVV